MEGLKKNILILSTGDINGAYEAMHKLAYFFNNQGHKTVLLVKHKTKNDDFVVRFHNNKNERKSSLLNRLLIKIKAKIQKKIFSQKAIKFDPKYSFISKNETSENVDATDIVMQIGFSPDIVFTGMTDNFLNSTDLYNLQKLTQAKVYTITVDMNHYTGGCHYAWDCKGYINGCGENCPAIIGDEGRGLAKLNFETKLKNATLGDFQIISGSGWTLKQSKESKIYKNREIFHNINSLIDTDLFNPERKDIAKRIFGFDDSKFYIMAGSQSAKDPRKGFDYFLEALKILETELTNEQKDRIVILVVSREVPNQFNSLTFNKQRLDFITDYRLLSLLYQAIDLFVNSSIEDSGPMMVSEALACGAPVVGFDMGVVNNMVITGYNGYKAVLKNSTDLALGIQKLVSLTEEEYNTYSKNAVEQVKEFSSFDFATKIFTKIINT